MLRILKTKNEELLSILIITFIFGSALFTNDVIFKDQEPLVEKVEPRIQVPVTPMTVPVEKKPPPVVVTELDCLASAIYHEARGESTKSQLAIGQVVLNRTNSRHFPDNICKVVFQPKQFTGLRRVKYNKETLQNAKKVLKGSAKWLTDATHFHTPAVNPKWASSPRMEPRGQIGGHLFYKMG